MRESVLIFGGNEKGRVIRATSKSVAVFAYLPSDGKATDQQLLLVGTSQSSTASSGETLLSLSETLREFSLLASDQTFVLTSLHLLDSTSQSLLICGLTRSTQA